LLPASTMELPPHPRRRLSICPDSASGLPASSCHWWQRRPPASPRMWRQRRTTQQCPHQSAPSCPAVPAATTLEHGPQPLDRGHPRLHGAGTLRPAPWHHGASPHHSSGVLHSTPTRRVLHQPTRLPRQWPGRPRATASSPRHPTTGATGDTGDYWFIDSGASSHMTPYPDNLSASSPITTSFSIIVGNGHALPITHTSSTTFLSNSRPLSLNNIIVSPLLLSFRI
jgi:hypothetical protein